MIIDHLHKEHCNIEKLLRVLEQELDVFDRGDQPDYEAIHAVISYFEVYIGSFHHPQEDLLFERLKKLDPTAASSVGDLTAEHSSGNDRLRRVSHAVESVLMDHVIPRSMVVDIIRDFISHEREHITMEERIFFPAALKALGPEDWVELGSRMTNSKDPLFSVSVEERFETVRQRILLLEQEAAAVRGAASGEAA
jgi:hemerythrin-like domain-containing protein